VIWCDVGQGDAILVMKGTTQMLIDGGPPNRRVIDCLATHVPFWDREIEMMVLTHPDADHAGGVPEVMKRYRVLHFVTVPVGKDSDVFGQVMEGVENNQIKVSNVFAGDVIRLAEVEFKVLWPTKEWVLEKVEGGKVAGVGGGVLGAKTSFEVNEFSIGGTINFGEFEVLVTGDADGWVMAEQATLGRMDKVDIAKVPHHGSKFAANEEWWEVVHPQMAVISVGKNNYGHPSAEIMDLLTKMGSRIERTDQRGDIEVVSDGHNWWLK
jgi:competence protein ComEC